MDSSVTSTTSPVWQKAALWPEGETTLIRVSPIVALIFMNLPPLNA